MNPSHNNQMQQQNKSESKAHQTTTSLFMFIATTQATSKVLFLTTAQTTVLHQKGRQLGQLRVAQPFNATFRYRGQFRNANGQIVQCFGGVFTMKITPRNDKTTPTLVGQIFGGLVCGPLLSTARVTTPTTPGRVFSVCAFTQQRSQPNNFIFGILQILNGIQRGMHRCRGGRG